MTQEKLNYLLAQSIGSLSQQAHLFEPQPDDAQDLLQDALLLMLEKINNFREGNFGGWAYTVMYNVYRNRLRNSRTRESHTATPCDATHPIYCHTFCQYDLATALDRLPPCYREVMSMHIEGYPYEEIASTLHLSIGTVKSRISRARNFLRQYLTDYHL